MMTDSILMERREDVEHDFTTIGDYPDYVAIECTCGFHAPPVGLSERPNAHIEHCAFRTNRLRNVENINQALITN